MNNAKEVELIPQSSNSQPIIEVVTPLQLPLPNKADLEEQCLRQMEYEGLI